MARGTTLVKLLDLLRVEAKLSLNPAHNAHDRSSQVTLLQSTQEWLWEDFDWPHMRVQRQVGVQAGQRIYDTPEDIPVDRLEEISVFTDGVWRPVLPGINDAHLTAHNSDLDERSWPPRRWEITENEDIEIWPIPDTNADDDTRDGYLKYTGIRNLNPLVEDADRADLDDRLLVLFAAGEMLASKGDKSAQLKIDKANRRYNRLRGNLTPRRKFSMFGVGNVPRRRRMVVTQYRPAE